ncbi:PQQ-binding-like beta-propeller repeat protein [Nocardia sp. NPDC004151]|uniref:outer membrane protein assembly factor BamB family protein n=1 Tax=Nocardia sp. NPDC004151 TaxID=3364304 RepID=UPI0036B20989
MPIPTLRERVPRRVFRACARVALAAGLAAAATGCGSSGSATITDGSTVPDVDLNAVKTLSLGPNESFGVMSTGVYTLADDGITRVDVRTGLQLWKIASTGAPPEQGKIQVLDRGHVMLAGWQDTPGLTAYDTTSGKRLWDTPAEQWFESDSATGQFVHFDPRTGAQRWSVDPGTLGCATPLPKDLPALFDSDAPSLAEGPGVVVFRCAAAGGRTIVGGLDRTTGSTVWRRDLPEKGNFLRGPGRMAIVVTEGTVDTVDMADGASLGTRQAASDKEFRALLADGSSLTMDSYVIADDTNMRLQAPDGTVRWSVPLDATKEEMQPLMVSSRNAVFLLMRENGGAKAWLVAYDTKNGKRTVVLGPGPTAAGEKPTLTMNLDISRTRLYPAPWGILVTGPDNSFAAIPKR